MLFSALVDADRLDAAFWPEKALGKRILDANALLAYGERIKCRHMIFREKLDQAPKEYWLKK